LEHVVPKSVCLGTFADYVTLFNTSIGETHALLTQQQRDLQLALNNAHTWGVKWKMILSPNKSKAIIFRHCQKKVYPATPFTLEGVPIDFTDTVKYLGVVLDSHLTYRQHVEYVCGKAIKKATYLNYLCAHRRVRPNFKVFRTLYKTMVRPCMEYASAFWNGASTRVKKRLDRIQRTSLTRILGCYRTTSYDVVNILANLEPLEMRRMQEEVKLLHRCIRYREAYPQHNLVQAHDIWLSSDKRFPLVSTLTRAAAHAKDAKIKEPFTAEKFANIPPFHKLQVPAPSHSPFPDEHVTSDDVLASLGNRDIVIFTDGSCDPNPGIAGAGVVITNHANSWINLEFPIEGPSSNIAAELVGMREAINYCQVHLNHINQRVVILCDCKFVLESIANRWNPSAHVEEVMACQRGLCDLQNVPEMYWCKAHVGIPGNEAADKVAKRAMHVARERQSELWHEIQNSNLFIRTRGLENPFRKLWEKHWENPYASHEHVFEKSLFPRIADINPFCVEVANKLSFMDRKVWMRLLTGKNALRAYLFSIQRSDSPLCECCEAMELDETMEHFLLKCPRYARLRNEMFGKLRKIRPLWQRHDWTLDTLILGRGFTSKTERVTLVNITLHFVSASGRKL
jgi:ribonuclease HI